MDAGDKLTRSTPLAVQVAARLQGLIESGEWPIGTKIPAESQLVTDLGISRNSIREGLRGLVHAGLLVARAGDGTYVVAQSEFAVAVQRRVRIDRAADVFEVREMIEQHAAGAAAGSATTEQVAALRQILQRRDDAATLAEFVAHDLAFHRQLVEASGNPLMAVLFRNLDGLVETVEDTTSASDLAAFLTGNEALNALHHDLLDAIAAHDAGRAREISRELVQEARALHDRVTRPTGTTA